LVHPPTLVDLRDRNLREVPQGPPFRAVARWHRGHVDIADADVCHLASRGMSRNQAEVIHDLYRELPRVRHRGRECLPDARAASITSRW
jgi:hypothetical protein